MELNTVNCLDGLLAELKQPVYHHQLPLGLEVCQVGWRASRCEWDYIARGFGLPDQKHVPSTWSRQQRLLSSGGYG